MDMEVPIDDQAAPEYFNDIVELSKHLLRPGISAEESQRLYDKWASLGTYDELSEKAKYFNAHDKLMEGVFHLFPNFNDRRDVNVLDVGAGTGLIGKRLRDSGFEHVDALDPSHQMIKTAENTGMYRHCLCSFFTENPTENIEDDSYDLLVMCGVCGPGAIPVEAFKEVVRILKPGGYIVNCMRAEYIETCPEYKDRWHPFMDDLIKQGRLQVVSEYRYPEHYFHYDGLRLIHQAV